MMTLLDPFYIPDASTGYLYGAIDSSWQGQLQGKIGPVQPFYWGGNWKLGIPYFCQTTPSLRESFLTQGGESGKYLHQEAL